ncbi:MAG: glycosyltransferase family 2 protein [Pyrinomonadaceae bacterium]
MNNSPTLSVVVPVYNGGLELQRCLKALCGSDFQDYEIIVVDDASTDGATATFEAPKVCILRLATRSGPAAARNRGVEQARGKIILFVDADVVVCRDTLPSVVAFFDEHPEVAAVFGSYDAEPDAENFVSQYKNLLHHFVHQNSSTQASTFWSGCGAVRRGPFEAVNGFDEKRYSRPSIEDIDLGYRLRRRQFLITLKKDLQVKHLKHWTIPSLLRADLFDRALPWSRLILKDGVILDDLNLRLSERFCAGLVMTAASLLVLAYFFPALLLGIPISLTGVVFLKRSLLSFFYARGGAKFALTSCAMLIGYYFYSAFVFASCYLTNFLRKLFRTSPLVGPRSRLRSGNDA